MATMTPRPAATLALLRDVSGGPQVLMLQRTQSAAFFVALAPDGQEGSHDAGETVHALWITPREALERGARGEIELVHATRETLSELKNFATAGDAIRHIRALKEIEENRACIALGREREKVFRRADPQYFEIHWSDPEQTGRTTYAP